MCSTDIPPTRLLAAENAAAAFIQRQGSMTQIGIVAFSGFSALVQAPTNDEEVLLDALQSLTTGRRTAIGSGILEGIDAIAEVDGTVAPALIDGRPGVAPVPVTKGTYAPDIIVLLTDGVANTGPTPGRRGPAGSRSRSPRLHDRLRDGRRGRVRSGLCAPVHRSRTERRRWRSRRRWRRSRRRGWLPARDR